MQHSQIQLPTLTKTNKVILISMGVLFLLSNILKASGGVNLTAYLGLSPAMFFSGHIYEILTYPLMAGGIFDILFNGLLLWFLGSELENQWGMRRYIYFLLSSTVGAGIVYLLVSSLFLSGNGLFNYPLYGMHGAGSALCLAYAVLNPDRIFTFMLIFPMRAKYFCMILVGMLLFNGFFTPAKVLAWGHLGAMGFGYLWMVLISSNRLKLGSNKTISKKRPKSKANLRIVEDDDEKPPKYWQ
ncbi:rhomboid family intramembrane serine protease [Halobacteriovorax sp. HLS]|uniref:rhomboid family intramembrane serine protease n=1 Tax=Halobacteriovorax sp. HLS TaxID=2234000 RepID=UPI000FDA9860|nr:rhomboid family intramembrane serine protease [Halobacteriovorax sp. HLS]